MSDSSNIKPFLLTTLSFVGGVAAGFLLAPKSGSRNRSWVSKQVKTLTNGKRFNQPSATGKKQSNIYQLRQQIHQGIQKNIPDAYKATEYIPLNESEMLHG